jgi:transcription factor S
MAMKFCPKCGNILIPRREGNKFFGECEKCKFSKELKILKTKENLEPKIKTGRGIKKEENPLATYHSKCPKCGYDKAQIIDMGIFYSDEDNLILLKCGKCGHSERIGRKTS